MSLKQLDVEIVETIANMLLMLSPIEQTTNLEVKLAARYFGCEAYQDQVSELMDEVAEANGYVISYVEEDGVKFRVYSRAELDDADEETFQYRT